MDVMEPSTGFQKFLALREVLGCGSKWAMEEGVGVGLCLSEETGATDAESGGMQPRGLDGRKCISCRTWKGTWKGICERGEEGKEGSGSISDVIRLKSICRIDFGQRLESGSGAGRCYITIK
jgi:hypothetical protein